jgi:hypothetical protein
MKNTKILSSDKTNYMSNYTLYNVANYKPNIDNTINEIIYTFVRSIIESLRIMSSKIFIKDKRQYKFVFEKGIETIIHVFSVIFYYTKNLELSFYHTLNARNIYIEYIDQITDDNNLFLQLSSKDAIITVYRKTICEINNEYRKKLPEPSIEEKNMLDIFDSCAHIYKRIIHFIINHKDFNYNNMTDFISKTCQLLDNLKEAITSIKLKISYFECIYLFVDLLCDNQIDINEFFKLLNEFIKKINLKRKIDEQTIKNIIYSSEIKILITENESDKIIDFIFSN